MNRGIKGKLAAFASGILTLTSDTNGIAVDTKELDSVGFLLAVDPFSFSPSNMVALKLKHSDDNVTFVDCDLADYEGGAIKELTAATDGNAVHAVGYVGNKRYVLLALDVTGTVSVPVAITGISTSPKFMPAI